MKIKAWGEHLGMFSHGRMITISNYNGRRWVSVKICRKCVCFMVKDTIWWGLVHVAAADIFVFLYGKISCTHMIELWKLKTLDAYFWPDSINSMPASWTRPGLSCGKVHQLKNKHESKSLKHTFNDQDKQYNQLIYSSF